MRSTLRRPYKTFLHHIGANKSYRARVINLREPKRIPRVLTAEQVQGLVRASRRMRDRFLICLLHETGMRIGQALGLRHEDIRSYDNEILLQPRINANGARGKSRHPYVVHVSKQLMELYADYLIQEYKDDGGDYFFVNRWGGIRGRPMTYAAVVDLFRRIGARTGVRARPHLFRHSHATELIRSGMGMAYVQRRLGHAQIQTTINIYAHLADDDLKQAFDAYLAVKKAGPN
jgi:integrase